MLALLAALTISAAGARAPALAQIPTTTQAQPQLTIPKFDLPDSGLVWRSAAHPQQFFDATGHRAAVFGHQDGRLEAWVYPVKILHGFHLEFQPEGAVEPIRGDACLEQVITRPESTTLVYVTAQFTVRQIIWVPLDEQAIVMFFDVDSATPLTISAKFVPDFKPMWPASFGGQNSHWDEQLKAFGLSDITGKPTAFIGSPQISAYTQHMDWALKEGELVFQLRATPEQAREQFLPIAIAGSMESEQKARENYLRVLSNARALYEQRAAHSRDFLASTIQIETLDATLNRAIAWSKVAIDSGWVCHPTFGCGLVAGYGPADTSERPGFAWWFGGDALMSSWALEDAGDFDGALQALRFLKARQRADGKIMHEMSQSVDLVDWFGKFPFAYYHADTTPMYIYSVDQYYERTGDSAFLREFWPSVKKAYEYCVSTVDPADGLMDNTKAGLAAVEVGVLRGKVTKDIYLEGFWLAAVDSIYSLAVAQRDQSIVTEALDRGHKVTSSLEQKWWNPNERYFAFGLAADGSRADMLGNWPSVMLSLTREIKYETAQTESAALASPEIATDWGARWLSNKSPFYDPVSYNNGTAWPFMNTFVSWAEYNAGNSLAGFQSLRATAALTGIQSPGYMPEHMNGDRFLPGERSVPHQLFSSVGVLVPAVRGLLGLNVLATPELNSKTQIVTLAPRLPANWHSIRFSNAAINYGTISGEIRREIRKTSATLALRGGSTPIELRLELPIPLGAQVRRVMVDGKAETFKMTQRGDVSAAIVETTLPAHLEAIAEFDGGIEIVPPPIDPAPGERGSSLKIIHTTLTDEHHLEIELAGLGGRTYSLDFVSQFPQLTAGDLHVTKTPAGFRLEVPFNGGDYSTRTIRLSF
ncbi:MAG TPA: GH116 family glycosyl hydrolase [Candidatus Acidoferrales bacterium]|nr:GH116 family glycosyl hydrolase [Candidatus Acidoferrales bacterium]